MNTVELFDLLQTAMGYVWILIWVSVSLLGVMMVGALTFVFLELTRPKVVLEINRRSYMGYWQNNVSSKNVKLEKRTYLERKRRESLEDGWAISKRQKDGLRNSFSKINSPLSIMGKIKKKLKQLTKRTDKS